MAFSKAARFPGREFSTPGPGSYSPDASVRLPRACAYTFGPESRLRQRHTAMPPVVDVGNLELTKELGSGGLATVFSGIHDGRPIAFKKYKYNPNMLSVPEEDRKALFAEAMLLRRLDHPNVVEVLSVVVENGATSGYTMQQLGESLEKARKARELSGPRLAKAFRQTCTAVAYIHSVLVAHLDIRAANICFASALPCSNIKLIDFDSAKELKKAEEFLDRFGGNLAGSSPEKKKGQPSRALAEDVHMVGHTFLDLLKKTRPSEQLRACMRARVMPLLQRAAQRPSMQQVLETWHNPMEVAAEAEPEPAEPLPTLLGSPPASGGLLEKFFA